MTEPMNNNNAAASSSSSSSLGCSSKFIVIFIISLISFIFYIASVGSNFAHIQYNDPRYNGQLVDYGLNLFKFCVFSSSSSYCSVNGHLPPCHELNQARSATAAFVIIAIIVQGFFILYLLMFKHYSTIVSSTTMMRRRQRRQRTRNSPSSSTTSPRRSRSSGAENSNDNNNTVTVQQEQQQQQQASSSQAPRSPGVVSSAIRTFTSSFTNKSNFSRIFIIAHIVTLLCGLLGFAIAFSLTGESHCGKKILEDYVLVINPSNYNMTSNSLVSAVVGPTAPCALVGWLFQILCVALFSKLNPSCGSGEGEVVLSRVTRMPLLRNNNNHDAMGDLSDFSQASLASSSTVEGEYQQV